MIYVAHNAMHHWQYRRFSNGQVNKSNNVSKQIGIL